MAEKSCCGSVRKSGYEDSKACQLEVIASARGGLTLLVSAKQTCSLSSLAKPRFLNPRAGEGLVHCLQASCSPLQEFLPHQSDCRIFTRDVYPPTLYVNRRGYLLRTHRQELSHASLLPVNTILSRLWPVVYIALGVEEDWEIKGRMRGEFSTHSPAIKVEESWKLLLASVGSP